MKEQIIIAVMVADESTLFCFQDHFKNSNFTVQALPDAPAALNLLRRSTHSVILVTDLERTNQPLYGKELLQSVLTENLPVRMAILISDALSSELLRFSDLSAAFEMRAIPYLELQKPFHYSLLSKNIHACLDQEFPEAGKVTPLLSPLYGQARLLKQIRETLGLSQSDVVYELNRRGFKTTLEQYAAYETHPGGDSIPSSEWFIIANICLVSSETKLRDYSPTEHLTRVRNAIISGQFALPISSALFAGLENLRHPEHPASLPRNATQ